MTAVSARRSRSRSAASAARPRSNAVRAASSRAVVAARSTSRAWRRASSASSRIASPAASPSARESRSPASVAAASARARRSSAARRWISRAARSAARRSRRLRRSAARASQTASAPPTSGRVAPPSVACEPSPRRAGPAPGSPPASAASRSASTARSVAIVATREACQPASRVVCSASREARRSVSSAERRWAAVSTSARRPSSWLARVAAAAATRASHDDGRRAEVDAAARRRSAEDAERRASRDAEQTTREAGWHASRVATIATERTVLAERLAALAGGDPGSGSALGGDGVQPTDDGATPPDLGGGLVVWEARAADLRSRRDLLAADRAAREIQRRAAEDRRARADAAATLAGERLSRADGEAAGLAIREEALEARRQAREVDLAAATAREEAARTAFELGLAADAADRERLRVAETAVIGSRNALRQADELLRAVTVQELEARLGIDAVREQALVELAGLGDLGVRALDAATSLPLDEKRTDDDGARLAAALARAGERWAVSVPAGEGPPPGRLAGLRRRFHELGAANPFAAEEYAAVRARLDELETQRRDLDRAIDRTRGLIAELDTLLSLIHISEPTRPY